MKRIATLFFMAIAGLVYSQDTTAYRMVGLSSNAESVFFRNDSTDLHVQAYSGGTGHAYFINPADSLLYGVLDETGYTGDRNLFQFNPFNATYTLAYDMTADYVNSGDLNEEAGVLYVIQGTAGTPDAAVVAIDMGTFTESALYTSTGVAGQARSLEFNPTDSSLYLHKAYSDELYIYDLAAGTESAAITTSGMNDEIHGAYYDATNDIFHITAYGGEMYTTDNAYTAGTMYYDSFENLMDLCMLDYTLRADSSYFAFCPNTADSMMISHIYAANSFMWYLDGVAQPTWTNDTIWASTPGMYQCIFEIGTTGNYMWSESIEIAHYTLPNVNLSGDTLLCGSAATGVLTGANPGGGTVQWYLNGAPLAGETNQTLNITAGGIYNQTKTNMSGCTDSSATSLIVVADPTDITVSISSAGGDTEICPGDTIVLTGETGNVQWYLDGAMLTGETNATLNAVTAGVYNQMLTLPSGCADSSATSFVITVDPGCGAGIATDDISLELYPNPVEDQLKIQSTELINAVEIYDLSGKLVISQTGVLSTVYTVNMDNLEQGTYVVKVKIGKKIINRKIVK